MAKKAGKRLVKTLLITTSFYLFTVLLPISFCLSQENNHISTAQAAKLGVGQNIDFVEQLINKSAAAKQILDSDNTEAHGLREMALQHLKEAREAEAKGDSQAVAEALHKAKTAIFKGMQLVGKKVVAEKKQENYQKKRQSLLTLLEAHQRIAAEKGNNPSTREIENFAHEKIEEAKLQVEKNNFVEAMNLINSAYLSVKTSLTRLRKGKTLVRTLSFETKEDEYRYELDRNDTHNMLINTVLKDKRNDPRLGKLMDIPLNQAEKLRRQAESEAARGDFDTAIKTMEQSTKQIIKAIRMGGIFIPG